MSWYSILLLHWLSALRDCCTCLVPWLSLLLSYRLSSLFDLCTCLVSWFPLYFTQWLSVSVDRRGFPIFLGCFFRMLWGYDCILIYKLICILGVACHLWFGSRVLFWWNIKHVLYELVIAINCLGVVVFSVQFYCLIGCVYNLLVGNIVKLVSISDE